MEVFWFIPTHGDGSYLGTSIGGRRTDHAYLGQIARAVDHLGFHGALLPTGRSCEDAWVVASSLMPLTSRMKFLVAVRPGLMAPSVAARMAATFDRLSGGRLAVNVVTGGDPVELAGDGLHMSHDDRYRITDEFLAVWRSLAAGEKTDFQGEFFDIRGGHVMFPPVQSPYPPLYFGGSSGPAIEVAAKHVDVYLTWGEPPAMVAEKLDRARELAAAAGRTLRFGIRLHVIGRETSAEAWEAADRLIRHVDESVIAKAQVGLGQHDSEGQRRMMALHGGRRDALQIAPNLWAGVGLVRGGAGTALVGNPDEVAERMHEYAALGIETFIFSGYPHLDEAYRVADLLFPKLDLRTSSDERIGADHGQVGEIVAHRAFPKVPQAAG